MSNAATVRPYVAIIILNWNGKLDTLECLASIENLDYSAYEVVVVDNGSTDDSVDQIKSEFPNITVLETGANLGYAGGNNFGIRFAVERSANYVLVLNNDVVVAPNLLTEFVEAAGMLPEGSVLGAKVFSYDQPDRLCSLAGQWDSELGGFHYIGQDDKDGPGYDRFLQVDYIVGCAMFINAKTLADVGLLDERFFLNYEETDWCFRAKELGYRCILVPKAKLWHKVSSSFGGSQSPIHAYFMSRNELIWARKHLSAAERRKVKQRRIANAKRILFPHLHIPCKERRSAKALIWSIATWVKTIKRNIADPTNRAMLLGLRDYYLGRYGNCPKKVRMLRNE